MIEAASVETKRYLPPKTLRWEGQDPIDFSVKFIFIDKDGGPVFFDTRIKTLLSLVTFNGTENFEDIDGAWSMKGPIGFHGTTSGIGNIRSFLNGGNDSLHSLQLIKGGEVKNGKFVGGQKILDLHKILVIKGVNIQTSEQLYLDKTKKSPAYKWITADIKFATVCPVPGPFAGMKTNVSNFYGIE